MTRADGAKRHIVVERWVLAVHPADIQDRDGAKRARPPAGTAAPLALAPDAVRGPVVPWVQTRTGWRLEIVKRPRGSQTFAVLPRRWVVERTFGWLGRSRRFKDYEFVPASAEAWIHLAMIQLMLKRLQPT